MRACRRDRTGHPKWQQIRYEKPIDDDEEEDLRRWHGEDPVDEAERRRAAAAAEAQGNANPFIEDPMLVSRIADF